MKRRSTLRVAIFLFIAIFTINDRQAAFAVAVEDKLFVGKLYLVWGDSPNGDHSIQRAFIETEAAGKERVVEFSLVNAEMNLHLERLAGQLVEVKGQVATEAIAGRNTILTVNSISIATSSGTTFRTPPPVTGNLRWATILLRFGDTPNVTPRPVEYFNNIMGEASPGLGSYWRESSYDKVNIAGSKTFGWYNLPQPRSYYIRDMNGDGQVEVDFDLISAGVVLVADADVHFPVYYGFNLA
ncbi:MAG TPA: hypothetical protein VK308_05675, partial [Pyrinomonadaceae bacterium]|nr:hypothetical protein [Pyrinomonadaceae bacterium]